MNEILGRRTAARRRAFLDAAIAVFLEEGYGNATVDAVIRRSGGSRQTLYALFGSKEGLFSAIIEELCERVLEPLSSADILSAKPEAALTAFGRRFLSVLMSPVGIGLFRLVLAEGPRAPEVAALFYRLGPQRALDSLAGYLDRQTRAGALAVADAEATAAHFLGLLQSDLHLKALLGIGDMPSETALTRAIESAVRLFLDGCRPPRRG
jgi:AcrR family transcriptional regulator